jgi:hypothetical protein
VHLPSFPDRKVPLAQSAELTAKADPLGNWRNRNGQGQETQVFAQRKQRCEE